MTAGGYLALHRSVCRPQTTAFLVEHHSNWQVLGVFSEARITTSPQRWCVTSVSAQDAHIPLYLYTENCCWLLY